MVHEHIREGRNDPLEQEYHGKPIALVHDKKKYLPPCQRDANAFGEESYVIRHDDPLEGRALPSVEEQIPPFSCCPTPYRWMLEDNFRQICEDENLRIADRKNLEASPTWIMEDNRQRDLLRHFWGKLEKKKSLVFYYCNQGNAVDDETNRILIGVSRIIDVGDPVYFGRSTKTPGNFPVWSRRITNGMPGEGIRIPYQEYLSLGRDTHAILCQPPKGMMLPFSYVAEHVTDGQAVSAMLAILKSLEQVRIQNHVQGHWEDAIGWCNSILDELWSGRGAFPGIGSVLRYLGCARGHSYHAIVLRALERSGQNPWDHTVGMLQGRITPPTDAYTAGLLEAGKQWRSMPSRQRLLNMLVRFELATDQVTGIANEDLRKQRGIAALPERVLENTYILYEQDSGSEDSEPIGLETIDQGMWPEGDAALFRNEEAIAHNDQRRVRATACAVLREAANAGDTLLPFETFIRRLHDKFPDKRRCLVDREAFWEGEERPFHDQILWLKEEPYPDAWAIRNVPNTGLGKVNPEVEDDLREDLGDGLQGSDAESPTIKLVALKAIRRQEVEVAKVLQACKKVDGLPNVLPNWHKLLTESEASGGFGAPKTQREKDAIQEKVRALEVLYTQRISILTGGAGTGKTSVLKIFLKCLRETEGVTATLLAAPTGKARVRLQAATGRPANTIHQILNDVDMLGTNYRVLESPKGRLFYTNVIIDESSMLSVELLAGLFRAIDTNVFRRLVLVGDPYQLPPIGPGRPFVDTLRWMRENHPECVAELKTCMRIASSSKGNLVFSKGLELAAGYRDEAGPGDDAVLSELVQKGETADVRVVFWRDHSELLQSISDVFASEFKIVGNDEKQFVRSLGIEDEDWKQCESWQLLSPTRIHPSGTDELNRIIQERFRSSMLNQARDPRSRWPAPMGDQGIVFHDKVMQCVNKGKWLPKDSKGLRFVANGEIGIVTKAWKRREDKPDNLYVAFSTQAEAEYRYLKSEVKEQLELAYALTVHKAQGSDFETVILIIPQKAQTLSRELLYTGLTRFKKKLVLLVEKDSQPLLNLRRPEASDTMRRTTRMFDLLVGQDAGEIGLTSGYRPEGLIHRTSDGTAVRSKSEVIVYDVLATLGLSIKYEEQLRNKDGNELDFRLPDFTIYHQGKTWYWEHLGMLDKASYRSDWKEKQNWYKRNNYWDYVITSEDHPGGRGGTVYADEIRETARVKILGKK